jgi:hypothetical protein
MTLNVGKKNTLNCLVASMKHNVGNNFFQFYHATLKTLNVGGNLDLIQEKLLLTKLLRNFKIQKDLWKKKKENSEKSLMRPKISLEKRLTRLNNLLNKKFIKLKKKHKE